MSNIPNDTILYARSACSALVISCSDFRFKSAERTFLEASGLGDGYDLIARPGAIRSLAAPRDGVARVSMEDEILLLWKLHGFSRVLMLNHLSCRAYDDLSSGRDERAIHVAHLQAAASMIEQRYDGVTSEAYLVALVDGALRVEGIPRA